MADQNIDIHEPTEEEAAAAWFAHNGARLEAGPEGISAIGAMQVALRAAAAHRREAHAEHEEYVDDCSDCELVSLRAAYQEVKLEYADYRHVNRKAIAKLVEAGGSVTDAKLRKAIDGLRTLRVPEGVSQQS